MTKAIVITGGNRGIGLGLVKELLKKKDVGKIFATTRNQSKSHDLLAISDPRLVIIEMDMNSEDSVLRAAQQITRSVGSSGVDILVNNAGIFNSVDLNKPINRKDAEENFNVNCVSAMVVTQAFKELLKIAARKSGHSLIVNIGAFVGSNMCETGSSHKHWTGYAMSKAALNMFTTNVSIHWKSDGIRCVVIHPGHVQTDMGGEGGLTVEESCSPMTDTILKLKEENNGQFYDWKFDPIPW